MDTSRNSYVIGFAVLICVVISAGLAVTATALGPAQKIAEEFDRQKNVMLAAGLIKGDTQADRESLQAMYRARVIEQSIELDSGAIVTDKTAEQIAAIKDEAERNRYGPLMTVNSEQGAVDAYVIPIAGNGLWSTLYGYLALEADGNTVRGITFYKHGETPGLGGNIEKPEWVAMFPGKKILDEQGELVGIIVKKAKIDPSVPKEKRHYVDGLSGSTITSNGVTRLIKGGYLAELHRKAGLEAYKPFFAKIWKKQG